MKQIVKVLVVMLMTMAVFCVVHATTTEAASSKTYREYKLPDAKAKFPMQLSNGLTVTTTVVNNRTLPIVKKGSETVWTGASRTKASYVRFTVTKNGDTFLYYKTSVKNVDTVDLVGINKNGEVFMNKPIKGKGNKILVDFIGPSMVEISINQNLYPDLTEEDTVVYPEEYKSDFYQLYANGSMKELVYFDKSFIDLAKKGQLKWTGGAVGQTYKELNANLNGTSEHSLKIFYTRKASYHFYASSSKTIKPVSKVRLISRLSEMKGERKIVGPLLRQYLGKPILNFDNELLIYKAGKNYLMVLYTDNGRMQVMLGTKDLLDGIEDLVNM